MKSKKFNWKDEWQEMPEFHQKDLTSKRKVKMIFPDREIMVHFRNDLHARLFLDNTRCEDVEIKKKFIGEIRPEMNFEEFSALMYQKITKKQPSIWYPHMEPRRYADKRYIGGCPQNRYPIYIISKGRASTRLTSKALERMNVPYRIVIEPQEYDEYAAVIDPKKILTLPFSNLGQGSIPARNWVWSHSIQEGHEKHWLLDDNIAAFNRINNNLQIQLTNGICFNVLEDFMDRYKNVAFAGFQYDHFAKAKTLLPAFTLNTRIYSCTLIDNSVSIRWRGKYNEDTDLCLRALKEGYSTILMYAFTQEKATTLTMKGGNTDNVYIDGDNRKKFAESLKEQHPDVVDVVWRFKRWHHKVDYRPFKDNDPQKIKGLNIKDVVNNYGMEIVTKDNDKYKYLFKK
jgi:hypothetical protein